jgi:ketosteroid isomerase-like protein
MTASRATERSHGGVAANLALSPHVPGPVKAVPGRIAGTIAALTLAACVLAACASATRPADRDAIARTVAERERAFAKTMADRDHAGFATFVSEEAVFWTGPSPLRGRPAVAAGWKRFYEAREAPFSWAPDSVEVLDSGTLALSTGPVHDARGKPIARFTSIWRLEPPGVWRVIFDRGNEVCDCAK